MKITLLLTSNDILLLNKPYVNEVTLREQNLSLKYCQPLKLFIHLWKGFRSFLAVNIGYLGQRAAKLTDVKVGGPLKKTANPDITAEV